MENASAFGSQVVEAALNAFGTTIFAPAAIVPSLGIALLVYLLVTRQLDMIEDDAAPEEFDTAGERNEWLGGPTSEWLGV